MSCWKVKPSVRRLGSSYYGAGWAWYARNQHGKSRSFPPTGRGWWQALGFARDLSATAIAYDDRNRGVWAEHVARANFGLIKITGCTFGLSYVIPAPQVDAVIGLPKITDGGRA